MERVIIVENVYIDDSLENFLKKEGVLQEFVEESRRLNDWESEDDVVINSISEGFFWEVSNKGHELTNNVFYKIII